MLQAILKLSRNDGQSCLILSFNGIVLSFCLRWCCLGVNILMETPLGRTNYYPTSEWQLEIASWLVMGTWVPFPFSHWTSAGLNLCSPCTRCQSHWIHKWRISPVVFIRQRGFCLLWDHPSPLALRIFLFPLLHCSLHPEGRGLMKASHLLLSATKSLTDINLFPASRIITTLISTVTK